MVDIQIEYPERVVKQEVSTEEGEVAPETTTRATGSADYENAVDLAFYPNIAPPKLQSKLKKKFPSSIWVTSGLSETSTLNW